jgi:hypothetical protein
MNNISIKIKLNMMGVWWLMPVIFSHSGGRDQDDHSLKSSQANSSWDPISKNPSHNSASGA